MTRKEYVLNVTQTLQSNAAILRSHRITGSLIKILQSRPDVLSKIATFGFSTIPGRRLGAKGLKHTASFQIKVYRNFPQFNANAREDIDTFVSGLDEPDAVAFSNDNNTVTLIVLPDTPTGDENTDILNLKSVAVTFDKSVKKEYKIPGGIYVVIMFGDSIIYKPDARKAEMKSSINKKKQARRSVGKIKAELKAKANRKLHALSADNYNINLKRQQVAASIDEFNDFATALGANIQDTPGSILKALRAYSANNKRLIRQLSNEDKAKLDQAIKFYKSGNYPKSASILRRIAVPEITAAVKTGITAEDAMDNRRKEISGKMKVVQAKIDGLLERLETYEADGNAKGAADTRFAMRKWLKDMAALKGRYKVLNKPTATDINNRIKLLKQLDARFEANMSKYNSVTAALQNSLNQLNADEETKAEIMEDVAQQVVAQQAPVEFAIQNVTKRKKGRKPAKRVIPQQNEEPVQYAQTYRNQVPMRNDDAIDAKASALASKMSFSDLLKII